MLTQIYEISTAAEARSLVTIGIDHIGVLVGSSEFPRELSIEQANAVAAAIVRPSEVFRAVLTANLALVEDWARELAPDILHLGAAPELVSPEDVAALRAKFPDILLMRSIPVFGEGSIAVAESYDGIVDFLLLDSHRPDDRQIGALGVTHDWTISRRIVQSVRTPVILAGGLGPDNVGEAVRTVRPAGVDSKTKTDRGGSHAKDIDRVRRFHAAAVGQA